MLWNRFDAEGHLVLENIDSTDGPQNFEVDLVAIDVDNDNLGGEVFVSTSLCDDNGMPLYRRTGYQPHPIDPYWSREAGDVEWGEDVDFQILHHLQMVDPGDEQGGLYGDAKEFFEKVVTSDLLLEPVETNQDPNIEDLDPLVWDFEFKLFPKDGKEVRVYEPNWAHVNAMKAVMDRLVERLEERIQVLSDKKKYFVAKKYIRRLSRAGMLQKKGIRYEEECVGGDVVRRLLPQGLNFTRYAKVWNALVQKGVDEGWELNPEFKEIKDWDTSGSFEKEDVEDCLEAPRGGFFLAERIRDELDLEAETLHKYSNRFMTWEPSPRMKAILDQGPRLVWRMTTEEIEAWLAGAKA